MWSKVITAIYCVSVALVILQIRGTSAVISAGTKHLNKYQMGKATDALIDLINNTLDNNGVKVMIPAIIRLVFHDCIDGCDACLNLNDSRNNGLKTSAVEPLEQKFIGQGIDKDMTRADFWALAGKLAAELGVQQNNEVFCKANPSQFCLLTPLKVNYLYGRWDCPTSPTHSLNSNIPDAHFDYTKVVNFFKDNFRMSPNNAVAMLGAHAVGRTRLENSDMEGTWDPNNVDGLNIGYYRRIMNASLGWHQVSSGVQGNKVWRTADNVTGFALNCDMALYKHIMVDFDTNPVTGSSCCKYNECHLSPTRNMFKQYATKPNNWVANFRALWYRTISNGYRLHWAPAPFITPKNRFQRAKCIEESNAHMVQHNLHTWLPDTLKQLDFEL